MCQINNGNYKIETYTALALEPIHVGTGSNYLGRVDNSIVRDPVTKIPKIPGSSLSGVMRAYYAMKENQYPACAGQDGHCGNCGVCKIFGYSKASNDSFAGLASFSDAHILLFPVATSLGPKWVTSPMALRNINIEIEKEKENTLNDNKVYLENSSSGYIDLGWLYLPVDKTESLENIKTELKSYKISDYILKNIAIVSDKLFSHIVNSNLEVRTSVAIDPETGTAMDKALFTYEAIPHTAVLCWQIVAKNPDHYKKNGVIPHQNSSSDDNNTSTGPDSMTPSQGSTKDEEITTSEKILEELESAFNYLEFLGIGGMANRGMGRMKVLNMNSSPVEEVPSGQ